MNTQKKPKGRGQLIFFTGFTVMVLFTCFLATYSWFSATRRKETTNSNFVATNISPAFDYVEIHQQDTDNASAENPYVFKETYVTKYTYQSSSLGYVAEDGNDTEYTATNGDNNDIMTYDQLEYQHCVLYLFHVRANVNDSAVFRLEAEASTAEADSLFKKDTSSTEDPLKNPLQPNGEGNNPLSNVLFYHVASEDLATATYTFTYSSDETRLYYVDPTQLDSNTGFLPETEGVAYTQNLNFITTTVDDITTLADHYVAIIAGYDNDLIEYLFTLNIGNDTMDDPVQFSNDWNFIV